MAWVATVSTLIAIGVALYFVVQYVISRQVLGTPMSVTIVGPIADGRNEQTFSGEIPLSDNQKEGLVFSYAGWFVVEDWMFRQGELRNLFVKGTADFGIQCPGLYLDGTSNTLILKMDTFGTVETIEIPNLPARKWIHFAIVVDQVSVDCYIDGVLRVHHTLHQLPRQNKAPVHVAAQGGWSGQIGSLTYHRYALSQPEISTMVATAPYEDSTKSKIALPPYFDTTWYTGRY